MAQIGTFTRGDDGSFTGTIRNGVELGAGWSKTAKDTGAEYVSVKLDDPSGLRNPGPGRKGRP